MSFRTWLYATLIDPDNTELQDYINQRVFPKKSMKSSREDHPYLIYKLGNNTAEGISEEADPSRQFFQIYVEDYSDTEAADYIQIDEIIEVLKKTLKNASDADAELIGLRYLETSQDLNDETLGTVFKYVRFQAILGKAA